MIENRKGFDLFCHAVLIAGIAVIVFPVYVGFCAATMNAREVFTVPLSLVPSTHLFENVAAIWRRGSGGMTTPFGTLLVNSVVMALVIAAGKISASILSAYAIVYFRFPLRNTAFWLIFVTLMLPVEVRIFPTVQVVSTLHLTNSYAGLTLPLIASATATFLFRQFFMPMPDELVDAALLVRHALGHREDVGDRRRARGNRHHHVAQAVLDPLRDLDFAFAREQLDRAHLAHVHPHRIGRAAEFGIDGRQRDFRFLLDFIVGRRGGRIVVQQQRLGVGRLLVHRDAHVVERADDAFERFRFREVVRQMVVDFGVREEAALLAELDQRAQLRTALFELLGRAGRARRERFLQQRLFLGATVARLGLFAFARRSGRLVVALVCVVIDGYFVQLFRHGVRRTG